MKCSAILLKPHVTQLKISRVVSNFLYLLTNEYFRFFNNSCKNRINISLGTIGTNFLSTKPFRMDDLIDRITYFSVIFSH